MRSIVTLALGLGAGALIGLQVHSAVQAGSPCLTPGSIPPAPKGHVLATFDGKDTNTISQDYPDGTSKIFIYRGPVTVTYVAVPVNKNKIATGSAFLDSQFGGGISDVGEIDIAPGDTPRQTLTETFSADDNKCKFGCELHMWGTMNLAWHIVATK